MLRHEPCTSFKLLLPRGKKKQDDARDYLMGLS